MQQSFIQTDVTQPANLNNTVAQNFLNGVWAEKLWWKTKWFSRCFLMLGASIYWGAEDLSWLLQASFLDKDLSKKHEGML